MSDSKLLFFPKDPVQFFDSRKLFEILSNLQFIEPIAHSENHYLPGEKFLSLLTFLGCSPNINLIPTADQSHCFVSFINPTIEVQCLGYTSTCNPKCPNCTKRIANWKTLNWQQTGELCKCDKCGRQATYAELNWKQECGFGRCGFEVASIYPHEAVPIDQLLENLQENTGVEWLYSYTNN